MHSEILTREQHDLLPLVARFKKDFGLVGGTAIALHIGHRESIDFDLFTKKGFSNLSLQRRIEAMRHVDKVIRNEKGELTFLIGSVRFTFFQYPFAIDFPETFDTAARMPTLLTLAAMKAFALGMRAKWKDYVDLYFIIRDYHPLADIAKQAELIFAGSFNEKLLRQQLSYFDDINYKEPVVFKPGFAVPDEEVRRALTDYSLA